jgi:hypothetical protein
VNEPAPDAGGSADAAVGLAGASRRKRHARRVGGFVIGLALLAGAVIAVARNADPLETLAPLAHASPLVVVAIVALTGVTALLVSLGFWAVTTRYGRVGAGEMFALISAAWLLNYLPLWPGMFGRLAYHKKVNRISVRDAFKGIVWANVINTINAALLTVFCIALPLALPGVGQAAVGVASMLPLLVFAVFAFLRRAVPRAHDPEQWRLHACAAWRYVELLSWAGRYWLVFWLLDQPVTWSCALALACIPTLAKTIPIAPNGVGVRTWAVGFTIAALHGLGLPTFAEGAGAYSDPGAAAWTVGLTADLVLLAVEILVAVPLGLTSSAYLAKRRKKARDASRDAATLPLPGTDRQL